jgi:hypothetical protein
MTKNENEESANYEDIWLGKKEAKLNIIKTIFNNFSENKVFFCGTP